MKGSIKKIGIGVVVCAAVVALIATFAKDDASDFHEKYEGCDLSTDVAGMERTGTYQGYLNSFENKTTPSINIDIDLFDYSDATDTKNYDNYEEKNNVLYTGADASVTWTVDVEKEGFYNIYMEYLIPQSRGVAAERSLYINGEIPFEDARDISFTRIWKDATEKKVDNQGNEIRPSQTEVFTWQSSYFKDNEGYESEPYMFYFNKGENTLTLETENEPMYISSLKICAVSDTDSYEEYLTKEPEVNESEDALNYNLIVQGEDSTLRSESSLYAKYDRSSPTTVPNSVTTTVLNYSGGDAWKSSGQWIEWEFEVPEDGYYNITIKARQNYSRGSVSNRCVYIDGEILFDSLKEVAFAYKNDWECKTLSDEEGTPYNFYLTKGTHTIRMEAVLGGLGEILSELEDSTYRLNQIYRKILVYTGANPDQYRDYKIDVLYPEIMEAMELESKRLYKIVDDMVAYSGQKGDQIATAQTVADQLERFCEKPNKITVEFSTFKDNITALGTASLNMSETKLDIDYIQITGTNAKPNDDKTNFAKNFWHEIKSFVASFTVDYDAVGDVYDEEEDDGVIKVWILTGRDQGTILKSMVDESFTPNTGVKVNVEIVAADALLNAVVAGRGPNVVLSVGANLPVDYALRGSAEDLTQFEGLDEVLSHYTASSYEQYGLDGALYGLPETQTFNVMFYRKDVLEELGLEVPNTWQELIEMLPTIQGNNLSVGIPSASGSSSSTSSTSIASTSADLSLYFTLLYQYGGDMYNESGTKTTVNSEAGVKAFDDYARYFNDYGLPLTYDFVSRFRSGEMPIGIMSYSTYNTLMVSAPEIKGLWDFTLIPGTEKTDEKGKTYIDRSDFITGSATMMIKTDDDVLKQNSWEFMKWWASTDVQVEFGREIEALLGSSARYNTANKDAFVQLAWSADDIEVLEDQWNQTVGIREVPGGYYTGRHITNAIRKVTNDKDDARETIIDYSIKIDEEIAKKRKEFGLPLE